MTATSGSLEADTIRVMFAGRLGGFALDAAFTVPARGVIGLFGPSGCGKTSVLRCIAGLHRLDGGFCALRGEIWQDATTFRPTYRRPIGYVFQEASLFAHLSVRRNLAYGMRGGEASRSGRHRSAEAETLGFEAVTALLGLGKLLDRAPRHLSGGERQRVAIGRALLSRPRLLLMDEPLSALDHATKDEILPFLEKLYDTVSIPVIYVSHDMAEMERLADRLVLMQEGRVLAAGPLGRLQSDPALPLFKAREAAVSLDAVVESVEPAYGLSTLAVAGGRFQVPGAAGTPGESRRLRIAAEDVSLARGLPPRSTISNVLPARIIAAEAGGPYETTVVLGLGPGGEGARLLSRVTRRSWDLLELHCGLDVYAQVKGVALVPGRKAPGA